MALDGEDRRHPAILAPTNTTPEPLAVLLAAGWLVDRRGRATPMRRFDRSGIPRPGSTAEYHEMAAHVKGNSFPQGM